MKRVAEGAAVRLFREERLLKDHIYTIRDYSIPENAKIGELAELPSALPDVFGYNEEWTYIINLD